MGGVFCTVCSAYHSNSGEVQEVITYLVWLRWEDSKTVTMENIKSYKPLFEGDEIMIDDRLVTILSAEIV